MDRPPVTLPVTLPVTYAYLVQTSRDGVVWDSDRAEPSGGIEISPLDAAEVARYVLRRRFLQLRADAGARWRDCWLRADVWTVGRRRGDDDLDDDPTEAATAPTDQEIPLARARSGRHLLTRGIAPDVVEIRTPAQVRRQVGR